VLWLREREYRPFPRENARDDAHGNVEVPLAVALLSLPRGGRVLEIGCGPGATLEPLARLLAPSRLVGVDIDPALLALARERYASTHIEIVQADARALPFARGSFDIVVDFGICYHIARAAEARAEAARVLVLGGSFVTETKLNQAISHPWRSLGRRMPWSSVPSLRAAERALMWERRVKA
jgi:ubiquinone/menaquinone biosynthesis C-methylase UbiE